MHENPYLNIIPINIIFNKIPYLKSGGSISKFENITYDNSYKITELLVKKGLAGDIINYVIDVEHNCKIGDKYNISPNIKKFNKDTPYRSFKDIIKPFIR